MRTEGRPVHVGSNEDRILVLAPTVRDGELCRAVLDEAGFRTELCASLEQLCIELPQGAATALLSEELIVPDGLERISSVLERQPTWSDLPLIVLTASGADSHSAIRALETLGNVMLLERPLRMSVLTSAVRAAVRSRRRQYQIREHLAERERAMLRERDLRREAEAANRAKDEFLSVVSHELRTPLTAMLGWSRLLRDGQLGAKEMREGIEAVLRNAKIQSQLVEDLLDVSRMASGRLRIEARPVELADVAVLALDVVRPAAAAKEIEIACELEPDVVVLGDAERLQQVVWNLVSNAVKFTPARGRVALRLATRGSTATIEVEDDGEGIAPEFLPQVFDRFRQADSTSTRRHGGLGLGLAIVRHVVELHGGTVDAASAGLGRGATFTVALPLAARTGSAEPRAPAKTSTLARSFAGVGRKLADVSILVVEDTRDTRDLLARLLRQQGANVGVASDAEGALVELEQRPYDLVVTDLAMPDVDGFALLGRIRALPADKGGRVPAIAVTGFVGPEITQRCRAAGFVRHVSKPFEFAELIDAISGVIASGSAPA